MKKGCWATWGEPGNGELECVRRAGHKGKHRIVHEWDEERLPFPPEAMIPDGYALFLLQRFRDV